MSDKFKLIKYIYLYLVSAISIIILIISAIGFINIILTQYVFDVKGWSEMDYKYNCSEEVLFPKYGPNGEAIKVVTPAPEARVQKIADCESQELEKAILRDNNDLKRDLVNYISMLLVALPLFLYHWGIIRKD